MIGKQVKGKSFLGTLKYILSKKEAELVETNMLGRSPEDLSREFQLSRKLRPNLKKCVYHSSLSLPKGERLTKKQWGAVAKQYLEGMKFKGSQYVAVLHNDTEHQHIHIVASRVRLDGTVVSDSNDYKRSEKVIRKLEIQFGLTRVPLSRDVDRRAPKSGELRKALREKKPSIKAQLQHHIDGAMAVSSSITEFIEVLESKRIRVRANIAKTGHISGISYLLNGQIMKGSDLGKRYTWQGLQKIGGIDYVKNRDFQRVSESTAREVLREYNQQRNGGTNERKRQKPKEYGREIKSRFSDDFTRLFFLFCAQSSYYDRRAKKHRQSEQIDFWSDGDFLKSPHRQSADPFQLYSKKSRRFYEVAEREDEWDLYCRMRFYAYHQHRDKLRTLSEKRTSKKQCQRVDPISGRRIPDATRLFSERHQSDLQITQRLIEKLKESKNEILENDKKKTKSQNKDQEKRVLEKDLGVDIDF